MLGKSTFRQKGRVSFELFGALYMYIVYLWLDKGNFGTYYANIHNVQYDKYRGS